MTVTIALIVLASAAIALLTALAILKDSHDSLERILQAWVTTVAQVRAYRAGGRAAVDWQALADRWRPVAAAAVMLLILGAAGAVLLDTFSDTAKPSLWQALLLLGLVLRMAMGVPCSWVRYVFVGDRKPTEPQERYMGPERRRHG